MRLAKVPKWIERVVVEAVHFDLVRTHGGKYGLRDERALDSALARPRQLWSYADNPDLETLAAAYGHGLVRNHPFVDGNKRVAFEVLAIFLDRNGRDLQAPESEVVTKMLELAASQISETDFAAWLRLRNRTRR